MICIRPMAPLGETACTSPELSARITTYIQVAGIPNRWAASATNVAKRSPVASTIGGFPAIGCAFATGAMTSGMSAMTAQRSGRQGRQRRAIRPVVVSAGEAGREERRSGDDGRAMTSGM